jgi:hypothetical protein
MSQLDDSTTLDSLPNVLTQGLTAVATLGFLSFSLSAMLLFRLAYKFVRGTSKTRRNQFLILIFNLILADFQQSIAFMLNVEWLHKDAIQVGTTTCWAQGWFVSTGDLSSGLFTLAIALHSYADIVHDFRLSHRMFMSVIASLWVFNYLLAIASVALHPADVYVRAGAWCWINNKYPTERLWLHYAWVIVAEFGTLVIYAATFIVIRKRVASSFYDCETKRRAESAARLVVAYPIIYVICTLPLVVARLMSMTDRKGTYAQLCIAGAMITSNGWLDVLLYSVTRSSLLFGSDAEAGQVRAFDTFRVRPDDGFGTVTTIEATSGIGGKPKQRQRWLSTTSARAPRTPYDSQENLFELVDGVKAETTVRVERDAVHFEDSDSSFVNK